ncbi:MAG: hypothetical protein HOK41_17470, partial [Nitrospina sp.]|nr:hypothetical protein [Nitrospina sp.]
MKNFLINSLVLFFLVNCASGPAIVPGKGAVYGKISAQSHKDIIAKASKKGGGIYSKKGEVVFTKQMVNYHQLKELYVCILDSSFAGGKDHLLIAEKDKMSHRSLAIAKGDRLWVQNNSNQVLTFFLAGQEDDIQVYSPVKPGERSVITVAQEGTLELGSDENEILMTTLFSRSGLMGQKHSSGGSY